MRYVAGVDIGNASTEVALAKIDNGEIEFLGANAVKLAKGVFCNGIFNL